MEKKTPLYDCHVEAGGTIVPFAGYLLPVQYEGVVQEHMAVRQKAGLFDVSHMGEVLIRGKDALANINYLFTNDFTNMTDGRVRYGLMCNEQGGVVDDMVVCRQNAESYLAVVNASNREKDVAFIKSHAFGEVEIVDISEEMAQVALQGPLSKQILAKVTDEENIPPKYYTFVENKMVAGVRCLIAQTGYTGEHGYELYCAPVDAPKLWNALLEAGKADGLVPCGLGARDTLRLEASMPLYGHEMDEIITPLETGLSFAVKMGKDHFLGKQALIDKGEPGIVRVGLEMVGRGIAREQQAVMLGDTVIGRTTSGTHCPFLGGAFAMALIDKKHAEVGTALQVDVRGRKVDAKVAPLPFYKKA